MEKAVAESAKLREAAFKLTEQAFAPITARMTVAIEKIGEADRGLSRRPATGSGRGPAPPSRLPLRAGRP